MDQERLPLNHLGGRIELIMAFIFELILALITGVGNPYRNNCSHGGPRIWGPHPPVDNFFSRDQVRNYEKC